MSIDDLIGIKSVVNAEVNKRVVSLPSIGMVFSKPQKSAALTPFYHLRVFIKLFLHFDAKKLHIHSHGRAILKHWLSSLPCIRETKLMVTLNLLKIG